MILVDTGPFVALFDPRDGQHAHCRAVLAAIWEPLVTTLPVLTEAFHILDPASLGSARLRDFIARGGVASWFMDERALLRCFALMEQYADHPMDLADASLVVAAEALETDRVLTLDRSDFATYRILRGHRHASFEIVG